MHLGEPGSRHGARRGEHRPAHLSLGARSGHRGAASRRCPAHGGCREGAARVPAFERRGVRAAYGADRRRRAPAAKRDGGSFRAPGSAGAFVPRPGTSCLHRAPFRALRPGADDERRLHRILLRRGADGTAAAALCRSRRCPLRLSRCARRRLCDLSGGGA